MPIALFRRRYAASSGLSPAQLWMLAAGGYLTLLNHAPFDKLYYGGSSDDMQTLLKEWWNVTNRAEHFNTVQWLLNEGHRADFKPLYATIAPLTEADLETLVDQSPEAERVKLQFIWHNRANFKFGTLLAWDMGRLINVCRFGYTAGYMTEPETWNTMALAARQIQQGYTSWEEMTDNYALGWRYWQKGAPLRQTHINAINMLKTAPNSPFVRLAWDTALDAVQ